MTLHRSLLPPAALRAATPDLNLAVPDDPGQAIRAGWLVLGGFFVVLGGAAALIPISSAASARGVVTVRGNRQTLQAAQSGVVRELRVREGDRVARGQLLVRLDNDAIKARFDDLVNQWDSLKAQEARLIAERDGAAEVVFEPALLAHMDIPSSASAIASQRVLFDQRRREFELERTSAALKVSQLAISREGSQAGVVGAARELALIREELQGVRSLYRKGLSPKTRLLSLERSAAQLTSEGAMQRAAVAEKIQGASAARLDFSRIETVRLTQITQQLGDGQLKLTELKPQVAAAQQGYEQTQLKAPAAGEVVGLKVFTVGAVLAPGQPVLDVVPSNAPLVVEAQLAPSDIGQVRVGAQAQIHFANAASGGAANETGVVETVSADRLTDPATGTAYYVARIRLDPVQLRRDGVRLRPGMPAQVFVKTRGRTVLTYLLGPLTDQISHTFRET